MPPHVDLRFDCVPLRSVRSLEPPPEASPGLQALYGRIRQAIATHGLHNTYYLHNARCIFRLTNDPQQGMLEFAFEGTVLTDAEDLRTRSADLHCELRQETCDWLTEPVVAWFRETVRRAVVVEFDRYIASGDLALTLRRLQELEATCDAQGGFLGMGL